MSADGPPSVAGEVPGEGRSLVSQLSGSDRQRLGIALPLMPIGLALVLACGLAAAAENWTTGAPVRVFAPPYLPLTALAALGAAELLVGRILLTSVAMRHAVPPEFEATAMQGLYRLWWRGELAPQKA